MKIKYFALAALLLLAGAGKVEAQCQPTNQPNTGIIKPQALTPSDYANQTGRAAVTLYMTDGNGKNTSHNLTVGTNTLVVINVQGYSAATIALYYTFNGGAQQTWISPQTTLNAQVGFIAYPSWVGTTLHLTAIATEKSGSGSFTSTTQDVGSITVTSQAAGIYKADLNDTNVYVLVQAFYGGTPNIPYSTTCTQAAEKPMTPQAQLNVANTTSGENRNGVTMFGATTVVGQPVNASAFDYISALPGDTIAGNFGGITMCTAIGNIFGLQSLFRIEGAKVVVKDLGHPPHAGSDGSAIYDVAPLCDNNSDPCDWQPKVVHSFVGRHTYWVGECQLLRAPDLDGVTWIPLCDVMTDASGAFGQGLIPTTIQLAAGGLSLPYPGPAPDLPIPGKCTKYPVNVLFTVGPSDLANFFRNIPN